MKVMITGATGYTGGVVLDHLLEAGHETLAIARRIPNNISREGLEWRQADFADRGAVRQAAAECDAVIHIGASHDVQMEALDATLIDAVIAGLAGSGRAFISTSATPVYGDTGAIPRDEREPIDHPHPLRAWRARHDSKVAALSDQDIRGVVLRPGHIYGRAGGLMADAIRRARATGMARYIGQGRYKSSTVHVDALARLYLLALERTEARGIYNAVSDEIVCQADSAEVIALVYGPGITVRSWPEEEARAAMGDIASLVMMDCVASADRARRELGWSPAAPSLLSELVGGSYRHQPLAPYHFV